MNKKGNQRYQETEEWLCKALRELLQEKDVCDITVSEVCRKADVHRTTFYGHFKSVQEMKEYMESADYPHFFRGGVERIIGFLRKKAPPFLGEMCIS